MRSILVGALVLLAAAPAAHAAVKPYDVNGDGRQDLVVGLPGWVDRDEQAVGALVALGSKREVLGRVVVLDYRQLGIPETPGARDPLVGVAVASADFDGDGRSDLALGAPGLGESEGDHFRSSVALLYGAGVFPSERTAILREPSGRGFTGFGESLVAGQLGGGGFGDLAVAPGYPLVYEGSERGLGESPTREIAAPEGNQRPYGGLLAVGDVTDDGSADLFEAIQGTPHHSDDPPEPGHLSAALGAVGPAKWVAEEMEGGPTSLAVGDVDGDEYNDLVTGIPDNAYWGEDETAPPGAVQIWWGGPNGVSLEPTTITQGSPGIPGTNEEVDRFGGQVAVGRLDRDRYADIVVGSTNENHPCGRVTIIRGGPAGYSRKGNRSFGFETRGVPGSCRGGRDLLAVRNLFFGSELVLLDFNGDRRLDLALVDAAINQANSASSGRAGVTVLRGTRSGISLKGARRLRFSAHGVTPGDNSSPAQLGRPGSSG